MKTRFAIAKVALGLTAALAVGGYLAAPAEASTRGVITGVVTDQGGQPVSGAVVDFHDRHDHKVTETDARGLYRLRVHETESAYFDISRASPIPDWTNGPIAVTAKETLVRDVRLTGGGVPTVLYGQVTDEKTGKPVKNLHIDSCVDEGEQCGDAWTDSDGWYALTEYYLRDVGFLPMYSTEIYDLFTDATTKYRAIRYREDPRFADRPGIVVSEGQQVRFDFVLHRAGRVLALDVMAPYA